MDGENGDTVNDVMAKQVDLAVLGQKVPAKIPSNSERLAALGGQLTATTCNLSTVEGQLDSLAFETAEQHSIWDEAIIRLSVSAIMVRQTESTDSTTGEITGGLRTCFLTGDGSVYATNSPVVARVALAVVGSCEQFGRFNPTMIVDFKRVPTRSGGKALTCSVSQDDLRRILTGTVSDARPV